jgi:hypothetical protein
LPRRCHRLDHKLTSPIAMSVQTEPIRHAYLLQLEQLALRRIHTRPR